MHRLTRVRMTAALSRLRQRREHCRPRHFECAPRRRVAEAALERSNWIDESAADALRSVGLGDLIFRRRTHRR